MAVWAVKRTAFIIMMAPTGTLVFRAARLTIHPLKGGGRQKKNTQKFEETFLKLLDYSDNSEISPDYENEVKIMTFLLGIAHFKL